MATGEDSAIVATALDYFEGWFDGDPIRIQRALHPELAKRGVANPSDGAELEEDTAEGLVEATTRGVGKTRLPPDGDPRIEVVVEDIYDAIASVTVRTAVYHEYLHLVRTPAGWKIANALWQRTLPGGDE